MRVALQMGCLALCGVLLLACSGGDNRPASPTPEPPAAAESPSPSATATSTATLAPATVAPTATAAPTETPAATPTPAPTQPPRPTPTVTPVFVQTAPPRPTRTPTPVPPTPSSYAAVVRLRVPAIGVDAVVETVGMDADGQLGTPKDPANVAWYSPFARPGEQGNALFAGFQFAQGNPGPFRRLTETKAGDEVIVTLADGVTYRYLIISSARYFRNEVQDEEVVFPSNRPSTAQWLTMITDAGPFNGGQATYFDLVLAERTETP